MSPRQPGTETTTWRGTLRINRRYARKPRADREADIRQCLLQGLTDPVVIAQQLGISKTMVLYCARRMKDIRMDRDYKPAPKTRRRVRLGWAK